MAGIYCTGQQSGTFDPPVSYRKKYRLYRPYQPRTGQFRAIPADIGCTDRYRKKKVVNFVPYRPVRPEYTVPASNPVRSTPLFRTEKNTGCTGHIGRTSLISANFGQYWPVSGVPTGTEKSFFFFFFIYFFF